MTSQHRDVNLRFIMLVVGILIASTILAMFINHLSYG
jgi:uncharacterized membrane protein YgaE (UPF0421/DUF939 family)